MIASPHIGRMSVSSQFGRWTRIGGALLLLVGCSRSPDRPVHPGQHTATIDFLDEQNRKIGGLTKTVTFEITPGTDKVVYLSDK